MDRLLLEPLQALQNALTSLPKTLLTNPTYTTLPQLTETLLSADGDLTDALLTFQTHQQNHRRILALRAEADRLETDLKSLISRAVELRQQLETIDPEITDDLDSSDEDDNAHGEEIEDPGIAEVDYNTLLSFASRIARHNPSAAILAERAAKHAHEDIQLQREEARVRTREDKGARQLQLTNGVHAPDGTNPNPNPMAAAVSAAQAVSANADAEPPTAGADLAEPNHAQDVQLPNSTAGQSQQPADALSATAPTQTPDEARRILSEIATNLQWRRNMSAIPFPNPELLRMGELGKLQLLREREGDAAVDRTVDDLLTIESGLAKGVGHGSLQEGAGTNSQAQSQGQTEPSMRRQSSSVQTRPSEQVSRPVQRRPSTARPQRVTVSLDFPEDDEDSDEHE